MPAAVNTTKAFLDDYLHDHITAQYVEPVGRNHHTSYRHPIRDRAGDKSKQRRREADFRRKATEGRAKAIHSREVAEKWMI